MDAITLRLNILETDTEWILICESKQGRAEVHVPTPFAGDELRQVLHTMQLANVRSTSRMIARRSTSPELTAREFGQRLSGVLFTGKAGYIFDACRREARRNNVPVRLLLETNGRHAAQIPWEFVTDPLRADDFLALRVSMVRSLAIAEPVDPITVEPPLRILGIRSRPRDLPELDYLREQHNIAAAFQQASSDLVQVTWLEGDRWKDINRALANGTWHILHFVGHGGFNEEIDAGYLELTGDDGNALAVSSVDIGRAISRNPQLKLIVLNACESASAGSSDVFASTAAKLMLEGVPAVVAMQYEITDEAALAFAGEFYEAIARNMPVDRAVSIARESVRVNLGSLEWATPVLFLASDQASLFDVHTDVTADVPPPRRSQQTTPQPFVAPPAARVAPPEAPTGAEPVAAGQATDSAGMMEWTGGVGERLVAAYRGWALRQTARTEPPSGGPTTRAPSAEPTAVLRPTDPAQSMSGRRDETRTALAAGPQGTVALATAGGQIRIWSLETHDWTASCSLPTGRFAHALAWHPAGRHVASANDDGTVVVWDVVNETRVRLLTPDSGRIAGLAFSNSGRWLAITGQDRTLIVVDSKGVTVRKLHLAASTAGPAGWARGSRPLGPVAFAEDDRSLVVATNDGRVSRLDVNGKPVATWPHDADVTALAVHRDLLATCGADGKLRVWNAQGTLIRRHEIPVADHLACSGDGRIVVASRDGTVNLWNADGTYVAATSLDGPPVGVGFSGSAVLLGQAAGQLQVWRV